MMIARVYKVCIIQGLCFVHAQVPYNRRDAPPQRAAAAAARRAQSQSAPAVMTPRTVNCVAMLQEGVMCCDACGLQTYDRPSLHAGS